MNSHFKYLFISFLFSYHGWSYANEPIRKLQFEDRSAYLELPLIDSYPILIAIEGSYNQEFGPESVLRLHHKLSGQFLSAGMGLITMERRGIQDEKIDPSTFHRYNIPSQRLSDHVELVDWLFSHPPENWNRQLFILGGSEGGPIAIKLSHLRPPSACIVIVGCGNQTFQDYIWQTIEKIRSSCSFWKVALLNWWYEFPSDRESYDRWCDVMRENPTPDRWWFGQTYAYWADALSQGEAEEFLGLQCPVLVVSGTQDIECPSTDELVSRALNNRQNVTYLRMNQMDHNALAPQWRVMEQVLEFFSREF